MGGEAGGGWEDGVGAVSVDTRFTEFEHSLYTRVAVISNWPPEITSWIGGKHENVLNNATVFAQKGPS